MECGDGVSPMEEDADHMAAGESIPESDKVFPQFLSDSTRRIGQTRLCPAKNCTVPQSAP